MGTLAKLFVSLGFDLTDLKRDSTEAKAQIHSVEKEATQAAEKTEGGLNRISQASSGASGVLKGALSTAIGFGTAQLGMMGLSTGFGAIKGAAIDMNASMETSTLQFTTLMGSATDAKTHVADLFQFAKDTPFETQPVIEASRYMRTFGGAALDTKENLKLFGDASAAVGAPINDVSFWMSRMYANIQGGQPFGEAAMRMQELGVMTPQMVQALEKAQTSGKSSSEVWKMASGDLDKFSGSMHAQAGTWTGLTSSLSDAVNITMATAFKPFFDGAKASVGALLDFVSNPAVGEAVSSFSSLMAGGFGAVSGILKDGLVAGFKLAKDALAPFVPIFAGAMSDLKDGESIVVVIGNAIYDLTRAFGGDNAGATSAAKGFGVVVKDIKEAVSDFLGALVTWIQFIWTDVMPALGEFAGKLVKDLLPPLQHLYDAFHTNIEPIIGRVFGYIKSDVIPAAKDLGDKLEPLIASVATVGANLAGDFFTVIKWMADHFGGVVGDVFHLGVNLAGDLFTVAKWFADHGILADILIGIAAGFAAWKTAMIAQAVWTGLMGILPALIGLMWNLDAAMDANPVGLVVIGIGILVGLAVLIVQNWGPISGFFERLWGGITDGFKAFVNFLIDGLNIVIDSVDWVGSKLPGPLGFHIDHIPHWDSAPAIVSSGIGSITTKGGSPVTHKMHYGGIVPGYPGQEVPILAKAGEIVSVAGSVPNSGPSGDTGGKDVKITQHFHQVMTTPSMISREMRWALKTA